MLIFITDKSEFMIKIKYSQEKVKFIPAKRVEKKKKKIKKKRIEVKAPVKNSPPAKELKIIHCLFGNRWSQKNPSNINKTHSEALRSMKKNYGTNTNIHVVLGEDNKNFLMENGVDKDHIICSNEIPKMKPDRCSGSLYNGLTLFYKSYLLYIASQALSKYNVLFLDYDCSSRKKIDKKDLIDKLELNKNDIQCPPVSYRSPSFKSVNEKRRHRWGVSSCLLYWRDSDIIKIYFNNAIKDINTTNDEYPLFATLEQLFVKLTIDNIYDFDTPVIKNGRRPRESKRYDANNYKDAYFSHR